MSNLFFHKFFGKVIIFCAFILPGLKATGEEGMFHPPYSANVSAVEGNTVILPCSFEGLADHRAKVVWTDQYSTLLTFADRRIIDDDRISIDRPSTSDWNLVIRNVKRTDRGDYFCQANTRPIQTKAITLMVFGNIPEHLYVGPRESQE